MIRNLFLIFISLSFFSHGSFGGEKGQLKKGQLSEGELLFDAKGCSACHGLGGNNDSGEFPKLAGMPVAYITQSINYYKKTKRKDRAFREMRSKVRRLKPKEIAAIGAYLAAQKL